ncbi:hypothetical protein AK830_g9660 [Neonectria ditissima]|uniref:Uncharacterized protein n=1 Tax=Neonectria ditissima TaxID=78410 RepID=A0A0P7ARL1_9HYPO|nr:hypothetical protein AK830_g9660 [Neonectria ditissima]
MTMNPLALELTEAPLRHADCCLSLSSTLLDHLTSIFSSDKLPASAHPRIVLSIGSGTGLLEALLLAHVQSKEQDPNQKTLLIEGVEVHQLGSGAPANRYLPEQAINTVRGTWELSSRLQDGRVSALMFGYPRQPSLVARYLQAVVEMNLSVSVVVWLGPQADWEEFAPCFQSGKHVDGSFRLEVKTGVEVGLGEYEMMAVLRR